MRTRPFSRRRLSLEVLERREVLYAGINPTLVLETNFGDIEFELLEEDAPGTVDNFLNYVEDGDYINSIFHRLLPGFVLQGGGFRVSDSQVCDFACTANDIDPALFDEVPTDPPIVNEFKVSNTFGTVAMAKRGGDPDSATSQFYVSLQDNSANLDFQNGGFTVFARVNDMTMVDSITALPTINLSGIFPPGPRQAIGAAVYEPTPEATRLVSVEDFSGTGVVHGVVFLDADNDGVQDTADGGRGGVVVYDDADGSGTLDPSETRTTTNQKGEYHLILEGGGDYRLTLLDQPEFEVTSEGPIEGSINVGRTQINLNFGTSTTGVLQGVVFLDANKNGVRDSVDGGRAGVVVYDDANGSGTLDPSENRTTTNERGEFQLVIEGGGDYRLTLLDRPDYIQTTEAPIESSIDVGGRQIDLNVGTSYQGLSWFNDRVAANVNGVDGVTPLDALLVINELDDRDYSDRMTGELIELSSPLSTPLFMDVDNDGAVAPIDALLVINELPSNQPAAALSSVAVVARDLESVWQSSAEDHAAALHDLALFDLTKKGVRSLFGGIGSLLDDSDG